MICMPLASTAARSPSLPRRRARHRRRRYPLCARSRARFARRPGRARCGRRGGQRDLRRSGCARPGRVGRRPATFGAIITRDLASNLNLIAAGRNASRGSLFARAGDHAHFEALIQAYPHPVIDGGPLGGPEGKGDRGRRRIATHALLLVETAGGLRHRAGPRPPTCRRLRQCHHPGRRPGRPRRGRLASLLVDPAAFAA